LDCSSCSQQSNLPKNENKEYDNSILKKINQPVAFAARSPSHGGRTRLLWAFAGGASGASLANA
jgi:hypothetical protein